MDDAAILRAVWDQVLNHERESNHIIARSLDLPLERVDKAMERLERMGCFELEPRVIDATDPLYVMRDTVQPDCLS